MIQTIKGNYKIGILVFITANVVYSFISLTENRFNIFGIIISGIIAFLVYMLIAGSLRWREK